MKEPCTKVKKSCKKFCDFEKKRNFALAKSKSAQSTGEVGEWLKPAVC